MQPEASVATEPVVTYLTPEQQLLPPTERRRLRIQNNELGWRPNTRRYRLDGSIMEAHIAPTETVIFVQLVWAEPRPKRINKLAAMCHTTVPVTERALTHLQRHGWLLTVRPDPRTGWTLLEGLDCDCSPRVRPRYVDGVQIERVGEQVALYRLYDVGGILLYVGITEDLPKRMQGHARVQPWWPAVARKTVAWYGNRAKAEFAETLAIAAEKPAHNRAKLYSPIPAVEFELAPGDDEIMSA